VEKEKDNNHDCSGFHHSVLVRTRGGGVLEHEHATRQMVRQRDMDLPGHVGGMSDVQPVEVFRACLVG